jgi:hypothetical protein
LVRRFGSNRVVAFGLAAMAAGFGIAAVTTATAPYVVVVAAMLGMGGGLGLVTAPATDSIMGSLPREHAGVGSAINDTTRELGGTLGVAIVGSVFASLYGSQLADKLAGLPIPASAVGQAKESIGAAFVVAQRAPTPAGTATIVEASRSAFMSGFHAGSVAAGSVAAATAIAAWFLLPARAREDVPRPEGASEFASTITAQSTE